MSLLTSLGCSSEPSGNNPGDECVIEDEGERFPGYPFKLETFEQDIVPALKADCSSCHDPDGGNHADFETFAATAVVGNCDYLNTFKSVKAKSDLVAPDNSAIVRAMKGDITGHPDFPQAKIDVFLNYIKNANQTCVGDGQCQPSNGIGFDRTIFETVVQPAIDRAVGTRGTGCSFDGCHIPPTGTSGLALNPTPAAGSAEMDANFTAITSREVNLNNPENSAFYVKVKAAHGGGASSVVSQADADAILDWIKDAQGSAPPPSTGCADATRLNLEVFRTEILAMMNGEIDWNDPGNDAVENKCGTSTCHGDPSRPFNLVGTADQALEKFACFIDLTSPSRSQVYRCPLDNCSELPNGHPGQAVFNDPNDRNAERLLSFLFASVVDVSPIDFGFYATRIDPLLNDPDGCAETDESCASVACHAIQAVGQLPNNNSQLGIFPNAGDPGRLGLNFSAMANFVDFGTVEASSLHQYPTNLCVLNEDGLCTGTEHGGGECFAAGDAADLDILKWAQGLRPNANAVQTDWLVTGGFGTNDPDDDPLGAENNRNFKPELFERSGGDQQAGQFVGLYSDVDQVDVGTFLGGAGPRIAYAVAYYLNTQNQPIELEITVDTINEIEIYINGAVAGRSPPGGGLATGIGILPPFQQQKELSPIVIKMFQAADDAELAFTATLRDGRNDVDLVDDGRLIILTGKSKGGI